jgi:hypothetical protein
LESALTEGNNKKFLFSDSMPVIVSDQDGNNVEEERGPDNLNNRYRRQLTNVWRRDDFHTIAAFTQGLLGSHSMRKAPADFCSKCGKVLDHVEIRGRWKGQRGNKIANRYISVQQLPTDAAMAACLAVGGPVKYKVKADSHVSVAWLLSHVVPSINEFYSADESNRIALVLGPALLWAAFQPDLKALMTEKALDRICDAYALRESTIQTWECSQDESENQGWQGKNSTFQSKKSLALYVHFSLVCYFWWT